MNEIALVAIVAEHQATQQTVVNMKSGAEYKLLFDEGETTFQASNDMEAQLQAREHLKNKMLLPQRKKNYLYRHTLINYLRLIDWRLAKQTQWQWVSVPF